MNADGTGIVQLTDTSPENEGGRGWSPDGSQIAIDVANLFGRR